jgi:hypothetical protein
LAGGREKKEGVGWVEKYYTAGAPYNSRMILRRGRENWKNVCVWLRKGGRDRNEQGGRIGALMCPSQGFFFFPLSPASIALDTKIARNFNYQHTIDYTQLLLLLTQEPGASSTL